MESDSRHISKNGIVKKIFNRIETILAKRRVNWPATLYINFRTLPLGTAMKMPIYIYGKVNFIHLAGNIRFENCVITRGMVKMGRHRDDYRANLCAKIKLDKNSFLVFKGLCSIGIGYVLRVTEGGILVLGNKVWFGECVAVDCTHSIVVNEGAGVTHGCFLSDSNHHFVIDSTNKIRRLDGDIVIGKYNWIGNNTAILKGTVTPDYTIVSQRSVLLKNYLEISGEAQSLTLAGAPAKIINKGSRRVFRGDYEREIKDYFHTHPDDDYLIWNKPFDDYRQDCYFK